MPCFIERFAGFAVRSAYLACCILLCPGQAGALTVTASLDIAAPPAVVWALVGRFCNIDLWHPMIKSCKQLKDHEFVDVNLPVRSLYGKRLAGAIVEQEISRDEENMRYSYILLEGPLPIRNAISTLSLLTTDSGTKISWRADFDADAREEAEAMMEIEEMYYDGLWGIAKEAMK